MKTIRHHSVELVDTSEIVVVVLGGGRGRRLYPLTRNRAKAAVGFGGKYRLIDVCLTNCLRSRLEKIFILAQGNAFSLNRHVWQTYAGEISSRGFMDVITTEEEPSEIKRAPGTADVLRKALPFVLYHRPRHVLVLSGDQLYCTDYRWLLLGHEVQEADITVAVHHSAEDDINERTLVRVNCRGRVEEFYPRPRRADRINSFRLGKSAPMRFPEGQPFLTLVGAYCFRTEALQKLLDNRAASLDSHMLSTAAKECSVFTHALPGSWDDVGTVEAFYRANMAWRAGEELAREFATGGGLMTRARHLPPSHMVNTLVEDSLVSEGVESSAQRITRSIVGIRTQMGPDTIIEDSILMGNDERSEDQRGSIGADVLIRNAIIDKNVKIGDHVRITNGKSVDETLRELYTICSGIVVVPRDTVIPAGTVI